MAEDEGSGVDPKKAEQGKNTVKDQNTLLREQLALQLEINDAMDDYVKLSGLHAQAAQNVSNQMSAQLLEGREIVALADRNGELDDEKKQAAQDILDKMKAIRDAAEDEADAKREQAEADARIERSTENLVKTVTGVSDAWKDSAWGSVFSDPQGLSAGLAKMGQSMGKMFTASNILGSSLMKVQEATAKMVLSASTNFAAVNKLTGATGEYNSMIIETMQSNQTFNVDMETASKAVSELFDNMSQFTELSKETQAELVEVTAQLEAVGISSDVTAQNFEIMTKSMGMTTDQAIDAQMQFVGLAKELGVSATRLGKEFAANQSTFAKYGKAAIKTFKQVAAAAKATGIEMSALLGITSQFDTFEGAAQAAGRLNAILGGGLLNSMDLLNASEEERVRLLIQSIDQSGKSWESMNRFEKMAVANAAGISDMAEASKLFGQSLSEYDKMTAKAEAAAASQKELEERAQAAASVQDKLARIMESFAIAIAPIVDGITFILDGVLALNQAMGGMLVPTIIALVGAYVLYTKWTQLSTVWSGISAFLSGTQATAKTTEAAATKADTLAKLYNAKATYLAASASATLSAALLPLIPAITAVGFALGGLGLALAAPFIAISALIIAIKDIVITMFEFSDRIMDVAIGILALGAAAMVGLPMVAVGLALMAKVLVLAAPAMMAAAKPLAMFGAALIPLGIGIFFLGKGLQTLGEGFRDFPVKDMILTSFGMLLAAPVLVIAGVFMMIAGAILGPAAFMIGASLFVLGAGINQFNKEGALKTMMILGPVLILFGWSLLTAAPMMSAAAALFAPAALFVGIGLLLLGKGINEFNKKGALKTAAILGIALNVFAWGLLAASFPMFLASWLIAPAALMVGLGLMVLAMGIEPFGRKRMQKTLMVLGPMLAFFGNALLGGAVALILAGPLIMLGGWMVGLGLMVLGRGLQAMRKTPKTMMALSMILPMFAKAMFVGGILLTIAGPGILVGGLLVGLGLAILGFGLNMFRTKTLKNMMVLPMIFPQFAWGMLKGGIMLLIAGIFFLPGAFLVGMGLSFLANGLNSFRSKTIKIMYMIGPALLALASNLIMAAIPMFIGGLLFLPGAMMAALGLGALGTALNLFGRKALRATFLVGPALIILAKGLIGAALPMFFAGIFFLPGALMVAAGLFALGTAIRLVRRSIRYMGKIGPALKELAKGLRKSAWSMFWASLFFAPAAVMLAVPIMLLGIGLKVLSKGLKRFGKAGGEMLVTVAEGLMTFGIALLPAALMLYLAAPFFFAAALLFIPAAILMAFGMAILADPLMRVSQALALILPHAAGMPALALGLFLLGPALISFGFGLFMLGIFASLPFFSTGLDTFIKALTAMATAFQAIPTEKAVALGHIFQGLAAMTDLDNAGSMLFEVAMGIFWIARALETLPEEKTISMALLATNMADLITAAVQLKPENVEAVEGVVAAAAEYAGVAAEMPPPGMDAFVQALTSALGLGGGEDGGGGGQDIVLELNGRELGRAIDAHVNGRHGLNID